MPWESELHRCFHIQIKYKEPEQDHISTDYELDLSEEDTKTFTQQYMKGSVLFKGKWIDASDVKEIEIRETPERTTYFFPTISSSRIFQSSEFPNVTRRFITSPPIGQTSAKSKRATQPLSEDIFIVHGRDHGPMKELKAMLYEFGLNPIVLHEQPSGSRTIVEKLEKYSNVGYAFAILTPDDLALPDTLPLFPPLPPALPFKQRARQNVVLEFGYFMGLLGRDRVSCLHKGDVELPSDMQGIVYLPFKNSVEEIRLRIMKELKEAGYEIEF